MLLRALKAESRLEVLSRPEITTLDNQAAYVQVGQSVPTITGTVTSTAIGGGSTNTITYRNIGLILQVIPRISPDGLVVMDIDASRSSLEPLATGIPVSVSATGVVINAPIIDQTLAQTTVSALSGQTIVLGGLLQKSKSLEHNTVPVLGDIPILKTLFTFDSNAYTKTEMLIIMTPHIIRTEEDAERIKRIEAARMHWCMADVLEIYGDAGLRGRCDNWTDAETAVVYPDGKPAAANAETIKMPQPLPQAPAGSTPAGTVPTGPSPNGAVPPPPAVPSQPPAGSAGAWARPLSDPSLSQPVPPTGTHLAIFDDPGKLPTQVYYGPPPGMGPAVQPASAMMPQPTVMPQSTVQSPQGTNPLRVQ